MRLEGEPKEGPPRLNRRNLFLLAARDAFRDGQLDAQERAFLEKFAVALHIPNRDARSYLKVARAEHAAGKLQPGGSLDPKMVFKRACALAHAKGRIDGEEREILGSFSDALGVSMMRVNSTLRQLAVKIDESARPQVQGDQPKLDRDRNLDGSSLDLREKLDDPLTQSAIFRIGVAPPKPKTEAGAARPITQGGAARPITQGGAARAPGPPPPSKDPARARAFAILGGVAFAILGVLLVGKTWFADEVSVGMLVAGALCTVGGMVAAGMGATGRIGGPPA